MQKQKQKRRLEELKRIEEQKLNQAKKEREMEKLKQTHLKLKRKTTSKPKIEEKIKPSFDPYAKALEIIGGVSSKPEVVTSSSDTKSSVSLEFKDLPQPSEKQVEKPIEVEISTPEPKVLPRVSAPKEEKPKKVVFRNEAQVALLHNIRARSVDVNEKTNFWASEVAKIEKVKFEKSLPGTQLKQNQTRSISPVRQRTPSPVPSVHSEKVANDFHQPVENVMKDIVTIERVVKPVSFVRSKSPDDLNIVNLMYRKEKERRKRAKAEKCRKRQKSAKSTDLDLSSVPSKEYSKDFASSLDEKSLVEIQSTSTPQPDRESTVKSEKMSVESISRDITINSESESIKSSVQSKTQTAETYSTMKVTSTISDSVEAVEPSVKTSISESFTKHSETKSITESFSKTAPSSTDSITKSTEILETEESLNGQRLGQILKEQLKQDSVLEHNLKVVENINSNKFLDEMRHIQETGRKAAELMLKASKQIARQADVSVTETPAETEKYTSEIITSSAVDSSYSKPVDSKSTEVKTGPLPSSDSEEANRLGL